MLGYLFRRLQWRLVFIFISISIVLMVVVWVFLIKSVESSYYNNFKDGIEQGFKTKLSQWKDMSVDEVKVDLKNISAKNDFYLINKYRTYTIIDVKTNEIIYSSDRIYYEQPDKFWYEISRSDNLISVLAGKDIGERNVLNKFGESPFFDYVRNARLKDGEYVFYFRYHRDEWIDTVIRFNNIIITGLIIAIAASLVVGYALSKTITVPIIKLMHRAQKIASGDFDQALEVKSQDEIGELTKSFNYMAGELKSTLNEISREKNKVETILNYMTDGIIAFNMEGEVIHINPAAKEMLNIDEEKMKFDDFIKKYSLSIDLNEMTYLGNMETKEQSVSFNHKYLRVYFAPFTNEHKNAEGIITVLQDITEQQKLENMRKEFVANVSHELRTPLTSVKSYAETLLDGMLVDSKMTRKFLKVIDSEADRMTRLVRDLLQLSRLDNRSMQLKKGMINIVDMVRKCIDRVKIRADSKKQKIENYVIGDIPEITADSDRIEQVILNLLSNAINYTSEKGEITVYVEKLYSDVYIKVTDTGIGIPEEDLSRIFERFYRVDKARSRQLGGTGLGLSIVREIIELHGGEVSIKSEEGKGTEITVKLPVDNRFA